MTSHFFENFVDVFPVAFEMSLNPLDMFSDVFTCHGSLFIAKKLFLETHCFLLIIRLNLSFGFNPKISEQLVYF